MSNKSIAWDKLAKKYDSDFGEDGDYSHKYVIYPAIDQLLGTIMNKKAVDLGCGTGTYTRKLVKKGAITEGIDFSREMINIAIGRNSTAKYSVNDLATKLPFNNGEFDIALSIMVLHSIAHIHTPVGEACRILKKGGQFIAVIPHPAHIDQFRSIQLEDSDKYLSSQKGVFKWKQFGEICEIPTEFYVRSLEYYFSTFRKAGFIVNDIIEPEILEEAKSELDEIHTLEAWQRLRERPSFIIFNCIKL
jgi:ubiquinone/menaquinone biosynthesis C-methylase UbiE